jgi:molecular chaperone GrpE
MSFKKKSGFINRKPEAESAYESAVESEQVLDQVQQSQAVSECEPEVQIRASDSDLATLRNELERVQAQAKEYLEGWQRSQAEFLNYKKRIERDQEMQRNLAVGSAVKRYLPVADDLERALANVPESIQGSNWVGGINLIYQKMKNALEADGVMPLGACGEAFDPNLHEAISQEPSVEYQSGQIVDVLQKGYIIGDKVLRPAVVRVAQ